MICIGGARGCPGLAVNHGLTNACVGFGHYGREADIRIGGDFEYQGVPQGKLGRRKTRFFDAGKERTSFCGASYGWLQGWLRRGSSISPRASANTAPPLGQELRLQHSQA